MNLPQAFKMPLEPFKLLGVSGKLLELPQQKATGWGLDDRHSLPRF